MPGDKPDGESLALPRPAAPSSSLTAQDRAALVEKWMVWIGAGAILLALGVAAAAATAPVREGGAVIVDSYSGVHGR